MEDTFNSASGRAVVASDDAETVGEIKGFVIDSTARRVESIHITGRGKKADVVPWSSIRSFGTDAVMIERADAIERVTPGHDTDAVKGKIVALDTRVLDTDGFERGTVENVMFDSTSGELTGIVTTEGNIDGHRCRSLGSYALIIDAA